MLKKFMLLLGSVLLLMGVVFLIAVYDNNKSVEPLKKKQITEALEQSVNWLVSNRQVILSDTNPKSWWMLYESLKIGNDERLADLIGDYYQHHASVKESIWAPLFDGEKRSYISGFELEGIPYYNQHFIYALNCANNLAQDIPIVEQQNHDDFCFQPQFIYRPACMIHQLMGVHFLARNACDDMQDVNAVLASLQGSIRNQLVWDFRVVDVYLQRVMMLLITGAAESVKPIWLQNILDKQQEDGGWSGFVSLIDLGDRSLGFDGRLMNIGKEKSNFHATAQGVYLLTYLLASNNQLIADRA